MSKETIRLRSSLRSELRRDARSSATMTNSERMAAAKRSEAGRSAGVAFVYSIMIVSAAAWVPLILTR